MRVSCIYKPAGTETFRLGSSMILGEYGRNMQNWDKDSRKVLIPDEGKCFIQCDQAGAEALIVAYLCNDGLFRSLFKVGIKPHVFVAMHLFPQDWADLMEMDIKTFRSIYLDKTPENLKQTPNWKQLETFIKKHDLNYFLGKKTCHASNYDMAGKTFVDSIIKETEGRVVIQVAKGTFFINMYHTLFPEIRQWHLGIQRTLATSKILRNLFGDPRYFTGSPGPDLYREAYAFVPQSTVGMITNIAYTEIGNRIADDDPIFEDVDLLQNGHDSILAQAPIEKAEKVRDEMKKHIERDLVSPRGEQFKMKSEAGIGYNWGPYKAGINEKGLVE